jgi:hypothetical protein
MRTVILLFFTFMSGAFTTAALVEFCEESKMWQREAAYAVGSALCAILFHAVLS